MPQLSLRCHMLSVSGVKAPSGLSFFDTKGSCEYRYQACYDVYAYTRSRGSIGAWIRNIDGEEALDST